MLSVAPYFPVKTGEIVQQCELDGHIAARMLHLEDNWTCTCGHCVLARKDARRIVVNGQGKLDYTSTDLIAFVRATPSKPWGTDVFVSEDESRQYDRAASHILGACPSFTERDIQSHLCAHWAHGKPLDDVVAECTVPRAAAAAAAGQPTWPKVHMWGQPGDAAGTYDPADPYLPRKVLPFGSAAADAEAQRLLFLSAEKTGHLLMGEGVYHEPKGTKGYSEIVLNMLDFLANPSERGTQLCNYAPHPRTATDAAGILVLRAMWVVDGEQGAAGSGQGGLVPAAVRTTTTRFKLDLVRFLVRALCTFVEDPRAGPFLGGGGDNADRAVALCKLAAFLRAQFRYRGATYTRAQIWMRQGGDGGDKDPLADMCDHVRQSHVRTRAAYAESKYILDEIPGYMETDMDAHILALIKSIASK